MSPVRVLYIGTFPPPEGGVRVLVRQLALGLEADERLQVQRIDLTPPPGRRAAVHLARCVPSIARRLRRTDVVMFGAPGNYVDSVALTVAMLCRAAGVPFVLRQFAGSQRHAFLARPAWQRRLLLRTVYSGALAFFETRADVDWFAAHIRAPVRWLPNHRPIPDLPPRTPRSTARRFVFLGSVNEEKGILLLAEAARRFAAEGLDIEISVYGKDHMQVEAVIGDIPGIRFHGLVDHSEVYATLGACDALVLPSYREGYPGVIIEAFMVGLPVIATRLEGISEMTEEGTDALLIEPGDTDGLVAAMRSLHQQPEIYAALCAGATHARDRFSANTWDHAVAEELLAVAVAHGG